ncbi:HigA family addiction module antitoxin [Metapseudomonas otitidis]|uniref:HigA family addiction module antitoxin n=1 Tax=Metapseudomonas otitidis TaxID=319939 RepID=UPI000D19E6F1|nr:HigA family addiction module antitoxin [Pseudomonas otitidis]
MGLYNPPHPAETLREDVLPDLQMSVTEFARALGMSRVAISRVLNGQAGISTDLAIRLELAGLSRAEVWVGMQADYDLWQARQGEQPHVERLQGAA